MNTRSRTSVEIPKSHRNEWKSKRNFQALIEEMGMYMPFEWAVRDYGIDGQVEITKPIKDSDSFRPESKYFLIQLKSTEYSKSTAEAISFPIPVKKIIQWFSANLPVMFVLNDITNKSFYGIWVDERVITDLERKNSNWVNKKTVTLKLTAENNFEKLSSEQIRDYVLSWRAPLKKIIEPGTYFDLKDKTEENIKKFEETNGPFHFKSIFDVTKAMHLQLEQAIYRIAITGPSRVGKSTLVNALLKRADISPTGFFQTTGVPIQILPGKDDIIKISFTDKQPVSKKFSYETIEEYASQLKNEDNKKNVSLVAIHLANRQLEHGVSFFDIPGLDDPDDNIYNYTWSTVSKANAILYLIDASSAEHGGFIFKSEYKKHILELGQSLDKIFLVFNKVNALTGNKLELLQERVQKDLQKLNLYDKVSNKIYYISADESLKIRLRKKKGTDSLEKLESDLWAYLLNENKVGLINLSLINTEILRSTDTFAGILNARMIDNAKRKQLEAALEDVRLKIPELYNIFRVKEAELKSAISKSLENKKYNILTNLENYLKSFPVSKELPDKKAIKNYLLQGVHQALNETNKEYIYLINNLKAVIDSWVEGHLKLVKDIIYGSSDQKTVDMEEIENFVSPSIDLSTSFGLGIVAGVIGFIINPPAAIWAGLSAFFGNLLISSDERRAKRIMKIMEEAAKRYTDQFKKMEDIYMQTASEHSKLISDYFSNKIHLFFEDLKFQMSKLTTPISNEEENLYAKAFTQLDDLRKGVQRTNKEINSLCSSF